MINTVALIVISSFSAVVGDRTKMLQAENTGCYSCAFSYMSARLHIIKNKVSIIHLTFMSLCGSPPTFRMRNVPFRRVLQIRSPVQLIHASQAGHTAALTCCRYCHGKSAPKWISIELIGDGEETWPLWWSGRISVCLPADLKARREQCANAD